MITLKQYFGEKPHTPEQEANAIDLLWRVNALLKEAADNGAYNYPVDVDTGTQISGARNGAGDGGFRLSNASTGAPLSSHKEAKGIDVFDPVGLLDAWITDEILAKYGLYRENPHHTIGWTHLTTRAPGSGMRTFRIK